MCKYRQRLMVHLKVGEGARVLYNTLSDIGTEFEARDTKDRLVADGLFLPKDVEEITSGDIRKIALHGCNLAREKQDRSYTFNKREIKVGEIAVISQELSIGKYSIYYSCGRLNVYFGRSLVVSAEKDIPEFECFPVNPELLKSEMKTRLTEFYKHQLAHIEQI